MMSTTMITKMPIDDTSQATEVVTLQHVIDHVQGDDGIAPTRRKQMLSALRRFCKALGLDAGDVVAEPASLRARLDGTPHVALGIKRGRWSAIRSLILAAMREYGFDLMPSRGSGGALSPEWEEFVTSLPDRQSRIGLSRFVRFCSEHSIPPTDVDIATFEAFRQALVSHSLVRHPERTYRTAMLCWNKACEAGPQSLAAPIDIPCGRTIYAISWDEFPPSFRDDTEAYLMRAGDPDVFSDDYAKPLRPATIKVRREQILRIASDLVASGFPAEELTDLAVLVKPANVEASLRRIMARGGGKTSASIYGYASMLRGIHKRWVEYPSQEARLLDLRELDKFCKNLTPKVRGMTDKNRGRLRQFNDPKKIAALINLPARLMRDAQADADRKTATQVLYAMAIELLIACPMRIKNLAALEVERHLVRVRIGAKTKVHVVIPGHETKTGEPIERDLPEDTVERLERYLKVYRPQLTDGPSNLLFPGQGGSARNPSGFGAGISKVILRETGIAMNPHLFRHAAAKFHLDRHPEDIETVRLILGHKSLETTMRFYAEMQNQSAFDRYDTVIAKLREDQMLPTRKTKRASSRAIAQ
jgi:integrase